MTDPVKNIPLVAVCVPTWNAATFIEPTLEAIAAQTYTNFKVLISDDASSDQTAALCEKFAAKDSRFQVIRQSRRLGWVGNVNALLKAARGDYFVFAFHDDLIKPDYLRRLVEALEANPEAILAYSDLELTQVNHDRENLIYDALQGLDSRIERAKAVILQKGHWWVPYRGMFRAIAVERVGGLKRNLAGEFSADWPWLLHLALLGPFVRVPEQLCCKFYKPGSLSRTWSFNAASWNAVALSCANEIRQSDLPLTEALPLYRLLIHRCLGWWRRSLRSKPKIHYVYFGESLVKGSHQTLKTIDRQYQAR